MMHIRVICSFLLFAVFLSAIRPTFGQDPATICENNSQNIACPSGTIDIVSAVYGRSSQEVCANGPLGNCNGITVTSIVGSQCNGLTQCTAAANNGLYTDPCYGVYKYLTVSYTCIGGDSHIDGDPNLVGLQGQVYQVHGLPNSVFNLVSTPTFQLNSLFAFLDSGTCNYNNTQCWTHPGTYLGELGFDFGHNHRVHVHSGAHAQGLQVMVDGIAKQPGQSPIEFPGSKGMISINFVAYDRLIVSNGEFHMVIVNSDYFVNIQLSMIDPEPLLLGREQVTVQGSHDDSGVYPTMPLHGLIGQTWKNIHYGDGRLYEGDVDDYLLASNDLFGSDFTFNKFQRSQQQTV